MIFTIEIKDEELAEYILQEDKSLIMQGGYKVGRSFERVYRKLIKEMIYEPKLKEEIISRTVDQAAKEIMRRSTITNKESGKEE